MKKLPFEDILDLFDPPVPKPVIGNVKQAYQYRNWVAHGKRAIRSLVLTPQDVYDRLTIFLNESRI